MRAKRARFVASQRTRRFARLAQILRYAKKRLLRMTLLGYGDSSSNFFMTE
jgi:hypothetical protein